MNTLATHLTAEGNPNSGATLLIALGWLQKWENQVSNGTDNFRYALTDVFLWINDNWPANGNGEEYELTMEKILDAVWDSDKLRWFHFINYIDAMRAGIWNTEIYETHLAEWYRHFSI